MMKYTFEGIGPQPPETVMLNPDEYTPDQRRDAMSAYQPTHERIIKETRQRVAAIAGEFAIQQARQAIQATLPTTLDVGEGKEVRILDVEAPDGLPPEQIEGAHKLRSIPYIIPSRPIPPEAMQ